jgi:hypothetical protein
MGKDGMWVDVLLDSYELDLQYSFCKMTVVINSESMLKEVSNKNSIIWLWVKITFFPILKINLSNFIKLAKITCVQVLGFVKDEWCFLVVFIKK